jgi:hypothetical protein
MERGRRGRIPHTAILFLLGALLAVDASWASDEAPGAHGEAREEHGKASAGHDFLSRPNHFGGVIGWSRKDTGKDSLTLGMEYSRWFSQRFGLGLYVEISEGQFNADTIGLVAEVRPVKNFVLLGGPGLERTLTECNEILWRAGAGYVFHTRGLAVTPVGWIDFVAGHEIYFLGVAIGTAF